MSLHAALLIGACCGLQTYGQCIEHIMAHWDAFSPEFHLLLAMEYSPRNAEDPIPAAIIAEAMCLMHRNVSKEGDARNA